MNGTDTAAPNNQRVIQIVVIALAIDGFIGVCALAWCLIQAIKPDPTLLTAFCSLTTGLTGVLGGMLISTRPSSSVQEVKVTNEKKEPVPTEPAPQ
jgi:hypothetical protein